MGAAGITFQYDVGDSVSIHILAGEDDRKTPIRCGEDYLAACVDELSPARFVFGGAERREAYYKPIDSF